MKDDVLDDDITNALRRLSEFIHDNPELCFKEYRAHNACIAFLQQHCVEGWKITASAYELETAWEAVYTQGTEGRRVVFCSEYDALPQVGHACNFRWRLSLIIGGHNLICVGGIAAALGAVERLKRHPDIAGQVCILGTPAEEGTVTVVSIPVF